MHQAVLRGLYLLGFNILRAQKSPHWAGFLFCGWWSRGDLNPRPYLVLRGFQRSSCHFAVINKLYGLLGSFQKAGAMPPLRIMYVLPEIRKLKTPPVTGQR